MAKGELAHDPSAVRGRMSKRKGKKERDKEKGGGGGGEEKRWPEEKVTS